MTGMSCIAELVFIFPKWPKDEDQNTDIISTSSDSDCLITQDSRDLGRFAPVCDKFLSGECYGILGLEDVEKAITS